MSFCWASGELSLSAKNTSWLSILSTSAASALTELRTIARTHRHYRKKLLHGMCLSKGTMLPPYVPSR